MLSYKLAVFFFFLLNWRVQFGKGESKYNNCIFKNCTRIGNSEVPNNILPFSFMFHIAERLLYFDIFEVIFNKFEGNFVFACSFPGKLFLFTMN